MTDETRYDIGHVRTTTRVTAPNGNTFVSDMPWIYEGQTGYKTETVRGYDGLNGFVYVK